jgi:hypothetical protein
MEPAEKRQGNTSTAGSTGCRPSGKQSPVLSLAYAWIFALGQVELIECVWMMRKTH